MRALRALPRQATEFHHSNHVTQQRRTFLGLQRTPQPSQAMRGYLVAQGAVIVLLIDYGIATITNDKTTFRSICQAAGWWKDPAPFEQSHGAATTDKEG